MNARSKNKTIALAGFILAGLLLALSSVLAQNILPSSLPLYFEANKDQTEFLSHGNGYEFLISSAGTRIALQQSGAEVATAQMEFPGSRAHPQPQGDGELPGKINYLVGNDPSAWQTGLPTFSRVRLPEIYPGIDLVFHGNQQQLEYDFNIAPGANPDAVKIHFDGVDNISLTPQGGLVLKIGSGEVQQSGPEIYQAINGARKIISGGYRLLDSRTVAFEVGDYDHSEPLVIDPVLSYSTYFGGTAGTTAWAIALNTNSTAGAPNGSIYIAGETFSKQFFSTNAYQTNYTGGPFNGDAFVAKFTNPATNLVYLTYLGGTNGNSDDVASGLAVDTNGYAFVTGYTTATNFPTTTNAIRATIPSLYNSSFGFQPGSAFVTELNTNGSSLVYSTYLGGTALNFAQSIAIDSADNAYVVGFTYSTNFPTTSNALQRVFGPPFYTTGINATAFLTEVPAYGTGTNWVYSTYLGGTNIDVASSVCVDPSGDVYVAGYTASFNFPVWNVQTNLPNGLPSGRYLNGSTNENNSENPNNTYDAFVTKFPPLNSMIMPSQFTNTSDSDSYSTLLGSTNDDKAFGITCDSSGCAYVTGYTTSTNFPVYYPNTNGPPGMFSYLVTNGLSAPAVTNVFLTKFAANGTIDYSTVFGGSYGDIGRGVAVDAAGDAFVVGYESSTNFPVINTFGPLSATNSGGETYFVDNVFVTAFNPNCSSVYYSVLMGGNESVYGYQDSFGYGIALDASDNAYITGQTAATNFPTANATTFTLLETNIITLIESNNIVIGTNTVPSTNIDNGLFLNGTNDAFVSEITFTGTAPTNVAVLPTNNLTVEVGSNATFTVTATGTTGPLLYQWQYTNAAETNGIDVFTNLLNSGNISGVGSNILTITNVTTNDAGFYSVIVYYGGTSAITNPATLTVNDFPLITTPLTNQTVNAGSTVSFVLTAVGVPPLHYSWSTNGVTLVNGGSISGANTNILTIANVQAGDATTYQVVVANAYSPPATDSAVLTVISAPEITTPLTNQIVGLGAMVPFAITAIGGQPLHYQWQTNGINLVNSSHIAGANTNILIVTNTQPKDTATYIVIVTNSFGAASNSATLTVLTVPSFTEVTFIGSNFASGLKITGVGGTNDGFYTVYGTSNLLFSPITSTWSNLVSGNVGSQGDFTITLTPLGTPELTNWPQAFFTIVRTN